MKIYSILVTVLLIVVGVLAFNYYSQIDIVRTDLLAAQNQLEQSKSELGNLRQLVDNGLNDAKLYSILLNDSLNSFLVAGNVKIASLSDTEAKKISDNIQTITNPQDKVALEQGWNNFLKSRTVSDFLAFSRSLVRSIQTNLENIH
jgi:hypothetical protein